MKLKVSDNVAFDVRFTLNDAGEPTEFGFRCEAKRTKQPDSASGETVGDFLSKRALVRMTAWIDDRSPLEDDNGKDVPAGAAALEQLYADLPNMPGLVLGAYLDATGAKAKSGN
jgi:hypothetical protein